MNITHIHINQTQDNLNEQPLDTKILVNVPIELLIHLILHLHQKRTLSLINPDSINDDRNAVVNILNNETPYKYSNVVQSKRLVLNNIESYSCHICVNNNAGLVV